MAEKTVPQKAHQTQDLSTRERERYLIPAVDIYETGDGLKVICDLPGVKKGDVDIKVDDDLLTIQGKTDYGFKGEKIFSEFELLSYYRQFQIGEALDRDKISADMKNGVLTVLLPKVEKAKPKKIQVNVK